ncbi:hypothetical protein GCM10008015_27710 [Flavobacterium palustre]|uniref:TonB C-terminal domain-containing protein n=1 Tax=Flavobacterium palustre TaxID=1476463 RepID=A0ABQ1HQS3_9FLAO|nr:hypothetical protein [Flavobacterium palustre]GGA85421.1 hypothetical protein GCM10008015_27710 [Flavobacterium palustre]
MTIKKLALLIILLHSIISFSQINNKTDLQERVSEYSNEAINRERQNRYYTEAEYKLVSELEKNSFQATANPDENNELSLFLKQNLSTQDLKKIDYHKITSSFLFKLNPYKLDNYDYTIRLTFEIGKDNKAQNIKIQTGNADFNKQIKNVFKTFPLEKLNIDTENKSAIISVQLFCRENKKTIIKASTNAVYDVTPSLNECQNLDYSKRNSCFYNELNKYILKHISLEAISKQKLKGEISIYPRFSIDTNGKIFKVNSIAPNTIIKNEIDRIIQSFDKKILPAKRNDTTKEYFYETSYILFIEKT